MPHTGTVAASTAATGKPRAKPSESAAGIEYLVARMRTASDIRHERSQ
jgi:hypothetical protein